MRITRKNASTQTQLLVLLRSKVDEQITVRLSRRVLICFHGERRPIRIHLTRQSGKLARVTGILEEDHVMRIETYGPDVSVLVEQILHEKYDADVSMMRAFGKEVGHGFVRLVHEVIYHEQRGLPAIKIIQVRQTLAERHSRVLVKQLLVFSVAVYHATGWRIDHDVRVLDQFKDEPRLSGSRRTRNEGCKWMYERQSHFLGVDGEVRETKRRVH